MAKQRSIEKHTRISSMFNTKRYNVSNGNEGRLETKELRHAKHKSMIASKGTNKTDFALPQPIKDPRYLKIKNRFKLMLKERESKILQVLL